jgi:uncharacterized protein (DUF1330 family)
MPKGYVLMIERITDQAGMDAYSRAAMPAMRESGAIPLAVDPQHTLLEGEWPGERTVLLEFPSVDAAQAWYDSDSYEAAKPLRQAAGTTHAVILSGFELPVRP